MKYPPHKISVISHKAAAKSKIIIKTINYYIFGFFIAILSVTGIAHAGNWREVSVNCYVQMQNDGSSTGINMINIKWYTSASNVKTITDEKGLTAGDDKLNTIINANNSKTQTILTINDKKTELEKLSFNKDRNLDVILGWLNPDQDDVRYKINVDRRRGGVSPLKVFLSKYNGDLRSSGSACKSILVDKSIEYYPSLEAFREYDNLYASNISHVSSKPPGASNISNLHKEPNKPEEIKTAATIHLPSSSSDGSVVKSSCIAHVPKSADDEELKGIPIYFEWEIIKDQGVDQAKKFKVNGVKTNFEYSRSNTLENFTGTFDLDEGKIDYKVIIDTTSKDKFFKCTFKRNEVSYDLIDPVCKISTSKLKNGKISDMRKLAYYPDKATYNEALD